MSIGMVDREVQDFVERIDKLHDLDDLRAQFSDTVKRHGIDVFAYHIVRLGNRPGVLPIVQTNYPSEWVEYYFDRHYQDVDPIVEMGPKSLVPFRWREVYRRRELFPAQEGLMNEATEYGLGDGLSIPIHGANLDFSMMSLVPRMSALEFSAELEHRKHTLHLISLYYHCRARDLVLRQHIKDPDRQNIPTLTDREKECLSWVAIGKTTWEISVIVSISVNTVDFHLKNAMRKLKVYSRTHAVVMGIMHGIIDL